MQAKFIPRTWLYKDIKYVFKSAVSKTIRKEKWEIIETLKHNGLSNQLNLEIYDSAFFPVANIKIGIHSQIKILTSGKLQQYGFSFIKIEGIWIFIGGICPLQICQIELESKFHVTSSLSRKILHKNTYFIFMYLLFTFFPSMYRHTYADTHTDDKLYYTDIYIYSFISTHTLLIYIFNMYAQIYTYKYTYISIYMYMHIYTHTHTHTHIYTQINRYIYRHIYLTCTLKYIHINRHIYLYICICIFIHIHTHTHIYTQINIYIYRHIR